MAISWGASIVIIGVLFKILHIGGSTANYMIGIGLGVEALLFFFLMGFNPQRQNQIGAVSILNWTIISMANSCSWQSSGCAARRPICHSRFGQNVCRRQY
ncbi:hypothetical protein [Sphingobacterium sp. E70]|uniref:GldL-related protein n=1 Tax=Sphingobacterium sp. E70 TaxID=2853439 RepID=UPI00359C2444